MKTLLSSILLTILTLTVPAQFEQLASTTDKGIAIAYYIDKSNIEVTGSEVTFTVIETGIKTWKEEFEIDTSEHMMVTDIWLNCATQRYRVLRQSGYDNGLVNDTSERRFDKPVKGIFLLMATKVCPKAKN